MVTIGKRIGNAVRAVTRRPRALGVALGSSAGLVVAAVAVGIIVSGGGGLPRHAVATVGGEPIDKASFDHWLTVAARSGGQAKAPAPKPPDYAACVAHKRKVDKPGKGQTKATDSQLKQQCAQEYQSLRDQALQLLISQRWVEGEARELGISVTQAEVRKAFEEQRKRSFPKDAAYRKFLADSGQSEQDILFRVRLDLLSNKLRERMTKGSDKVTDGQVAEYYRQNKTRFAQPERRDLRIVLTNTKAEAEEAKAALLAGDAWPAVVDAYSIDKTSKSEGGKLPGVAEGEQEKGLDEAVFNAPKSELTGPVKTQFGYYVFEVTKVARGSQQTLEQATPTIKQLLASETQQKRLDDFVKRFREKWKARTECREGYVMQDCANAPQPTPTPAAAQPSQRSSG